VTRLEEVLNKPRVVLVVGVVAVAVNVLFYFGYYLPRTAPLIERIPSISTSLPEAISKSFTEAYLVMPSDSPPPESSTPHQQQSPPQQLSPPPQFSPSPRSSPVPQVSPPPTQSSPLPEAPQQSPLPGAPPEPPSAQHQQYQ
jgi:hypothetical protein